MSCFSNLKEQIVGNEHLKELYLGASNTLFLKIAGTAAGFLFTLVVSRSLGAQALGNFGICLSVLTIFAIIGKLGLDMAILKLVAKYYSKSEYAVGNHIYFKSLLLSVGFSTVMAVIAFYASHLIADKIFEKLHIAKHLQIASLAIVPMSIMMMNAQFLRATKRMKEFAFIQFLAPYSFSLITILFLQFIIPREYLVIASFVSATYLICIVSIYLSKKNLQFQLQKKDKTYKLKRLLSISLPLLIANSVFFFTGWVDTIMLGMFRSEAEVGVYTLALKLSHFITLTFLAVNSIAAPKFSELHGKGDFVNLGKILRQSTKLTMLSSLPIFLIYISFPDYILSFFGSEFSSGVSVLVILSFALFINATCGCVGDFLQMTGHHLIFQNIMIGTTILNIALNYLLIPRYGVNGAAIATLIGMTTWNISSVLYIKSKFNLFSIYNPFNKLIKS